MPAAPVPPTSRLRVVVGEEELLRGRAVAAVRAAVTALHPDVEEHGLPAAGLPTGQLADVLAPSLFGGHRLVVVEGVQEAAGALVDALKAYLSDPDPDITLVLVHAGGKRNEALLKAFRAAGAAVDECPRLRASELGGFVRNEVRLSGGRITADGVSALVEAVGSDLRALAAAAGQLVADFGTTIDADVVARFHRGQAEVTGFEVSDLLMSGRTGAAAEALRWALLHGTAAVLLADAIATGVRNVAWVKSLPSGASKELFARTRIPSWKVSDVRRWAQSWSWEGLGLALQVVADLNADVKGAAAEPEYALERAVRRLAAIRGETGRGRREVAAR